MYLRRHVCLHLSFLRCFKCEAADFLCHLTFLTLLNDSVFLCHNRPHTRVEKQCSMTEQNIGKGAVYHPINEFISLSMTTSSLYFPATY
uniref:Secreted protein n=1 Tax=Pyxicephalus adspersus TaxID=30357 RepID=A0AAV3B4A1_PYXAD|nr:TPA: hypothetical protein GDO54_001996 [Pyxicephalus adspersus]